MSYQNNGQRQMYKGQWTCAQCNGEVTELPFQPSDDRPLYCDVCNRERRAQRDK